jgi:hypothetical protein
VITCSLYGRLGNQAFQIACTISHALRNNVPYKIPVKTADPRVWPAYFSHFPRLLPSDKIKNVYKEPEFHYQPIPFVDDTMLNGYFQSDRYFADYREEILKAFRIPWKPKPGYVSIHVRRGDYLQFADKHPPVTEEYLCKAIARFPGWKFLVFSDDMKWCKEHFLGSQFEFAERDTALNDISKMSSCEHNIVANSSFSWMGAWFNQNEDKVVVSPHEDNWFGVNNKHLNVKDLLPENWVRIKY